jgi:hypothetical protein
MNGKGVAAGLLTSQYLATSLHCLHAVQSIGNEPISLRVSKSIAL